MACKKNCRFHIVFATKYRYAILHDEARAYLQEFWGKAKTQESLGYKLISCAVEKDHAHLVLEYNGSPVESLVGKLKGRSAFALHRKFRNLRRYTIWNSGFYVGTVGEVSQKTVEGYLFKQGYRETETIDRTFKFSVLPSKRKARLCQQYIEGVKEKDGKKVPAAMLQRTEGNPTDSFKLRNDLYALHEAGHVRADYAIKVPGGKKCRTRPFWLALKSHRPLPENFTTREAYVRQEKGQLVVLMVIREEREINRFDPQKAIGLDLGIQRLATSVALQGGKIRACSFWGKEVKRQIWLREKRRSTLQSASEKYSWEYNKACTLKYNRRIEDAIHKYTRELVDYAKQNGYGIVVGNLLGIREKSKHRYGAKSNNTSNFNLHRMPFGKIKDCLQYKAKLAQVPLVFIDEAYTSQACNHCGHIDAGNRNRRAFSCKACGHKTDADLNGAINIVAKASQLSTDDCALERTSKFHPLSLAGCNGNPIL